MRLLTPALLALSLTACAKPSPQIVQLSDQTDATLRAAIAAAETIDREHLTPCALPDEAFRPPATWGAATEQTDQALAWGVCERGRADEMVNWRTALMATLRARLAVTGP